MLSTPLTELEVLLLDGQTTGASPAHGELIELAWCRTSAPAATASLRVRSRLLDLATDRQLPPRIAAMTGLRAEDLLGSMAPTRAWRDLLSDITAPPQVSVIHFARFEEPFLRALHRAASPHTQFPLRLVCTHEIARRLLPALPRRTLRALAGYFGHNTSELKRAGEHVVATAVIWRALLGQLQQRLAISTLDELTNWLREPPPPRPRRREYPLSRADRLALPTTPGVYTMLGSDDEILYVGKATSLRHRVNSYFTKHRGHAEHTLEMLTRVKRVEVTQTGSALEAALAESDAIKRLTPPYNIALRDRDQGVQFASRDLLELVAEPDARHPLGPLSGARSILSIGRFSSLDATTTPPDAIASILLVPEDRAPEPDVFALGVEHLHAAHGVDRTPLALIRLGHHLWRNILRQDDHSIDDEPADERSSEPEPANAREDWRPESVAAVLEQRALRAAHHLRRARWLCHLTDCALTWERKSGPDGTLCMQHGRVIRAQDRIPDRAPSLDERQRLFDRATWERLRILTTELRRLVAANRRIDLRLNARTTMTTAGLRRLLRWV